jgi:hypothetical protein
MLFEGGYFRGSQPPTYDVAADGRLLMLNAGTSDQLDTQPFTVIVNWLDEVRRRGVVR